MVDSISISVVYPKTKQFQQTSNTEQFVFIVSQSFGIVYDGAH